MNSENSFVIGWVVKTVLFLTLGTAIAGAVTQGLFCSHSAARELWGSAVLGTIVGAFVGVAQATQMTSIVRDSKSWIMASTAGWAIGIFLFEISWPISLCLTSSNAPSYVPGQSIQTVHRTIFIFAEQMERIIEGEITHGSMYIGVTVLLMVSLMGVMIGVPQGIGQWLVLRKDMPRSAMMVWVHPLLWAIALLLIVSVIDWVNFNRALTLLLTPIVLIGQAAATALVLVCLQRKERGTTP